VSRAKEAAKNKRRRKFFVCEPDHVVTDAEWNQMQYHLDRCFCAWVIRHGPTAVYNYMHFFGADHILYYGKRWKNLAILNQQGFEACQGWDQAFANHSTQRGGRIGKQKKENKYHAGFNKKSSSKNRIRNYQKKKPKEERGRFYKKKKGGMEKE